MADAINKLREQGAISRMPITDVIAATSVGRLAGEIIVDLCYEEDSAAEVDMNMGMTGAGRFVEIQGTGEEATFTRQEMNSMINLAERGISDLISCQKEALGDIALAIGG
jgi:ribonuclease PH